jgi:hypothetical protein
MESLTTWQIEEMIYQMAQFGRFLTVLRDDERRLLE